MTDEVIDPLGEFPETTPIGFAERVLGFTGDTKLYWWQETILSRFENTLHRSKVTLATPNGSGKSSVLVPALVLWWLAVHPQGKVVITTHDSRQLDSQVWPGLIRHKEKFPEWRWIEREIHNGTGGFCVGFTTDQEGRAEGWHKIDDINGPLLIIVDEAKSVPEPIFQAIDRCTFNGLLYVSSPGLTQGTFYDSQTKVTHGFLRLQIGLKDCPHVPEERIRDIIAKYSLEHPFTQSTLFGKFVDADSESMFVVPRSAVQAVLDTPPAFIPGAQRAYCDFAMGGAENVLAHMIGNRVQPLVAWRDHNPMAAIARFIMEFRKRNLRPNEIWAGESGIDVPIMARFRELGWAINGVDVGSRKTRDPNYENVNAEIWLGGSQTIQRGEVILPDDQIMVGQMCSRKIKLMSDGTMGIERKADYFKRMGRDAQLDRGDAVLGVISIDRKMASTLFDREGLARLESIARPSAPENGALSDVGEEGLEYEVGAADSWLRVWERPVFGLSYLAVLNPARHNEPELDHSLMILRTSYTDEKGGAFHPVRLVARVILPCKDNAGPLIDKVRKLTAWYGSCPIVPLYNDRSDLIDLMLKDGMHLYVRENFDRVKSGRPESVEFGFEVNQYTRSHLITAIAEHVRENLVDIEDVAAVMQLHMLSDNNTSTLKDAEAIGVGLKCISFASTNRPRRRSINRKWKTPSNAMIS